MKCQHINCLVEVSGRVLLINSIVYTFCNKHINNYLEYKRNLNDSTYDYINQIEEFKIGD